MSAFFFYLRKFSFMPEYNSAPKKFVLDVSIFTHFSGFFHSHYLHKVRKRPHFLNISEHIAFTFRSRKSIFTYQKSIFPLSTCIFRCYNTHVLQRAHSFSASQQTETFTLVSEPAFRFQEGFHMLRYKEVFTMNETTRKQTRLNSTAYGALPRHINR